MDDREKVSSVPPKDEVEIGHWKEAFYKQIVEELNTEERFVNFFKQYSAHSVKSWIESYAHSKVYWHLYGENNLSYKKTADSRWLKSAEHCLEMIQQKKLFDVECQWRGNKIKLNEVEITNDFIRWSKLIFDCPFVEPVNETDIELMKRFLNACGPDRPFADSFNAYYYDELREDFFDEGKSENNIYRGSWYDYHNSCTGNDIYMALPDERGKKEMFYIRLAADEYLKQNEAAIKEVQAKADQRPYLGTGDKNMEYFAKNFDTKESWKKYKERSEWHKPFHYEKNESIEEDLTVLREAKRYVALENADDWRDAVRRAAEEYRRTMTGEALTQVFEKYLWCRKNNERFPPGGEGNSITFLTDSDAIKERIFRGRELNGEPRNLNF